MISYDKLHAIFNDCDQWMTRYQLGAKLSRPSDKLNAQDIIALRRLMSRGIIIRREVLRAGHRYHEYRRVQS